MGFFSWLTADTRESIASRHSDMPVKTVYLLQPGGREPIREDSYEGYGDFGDVDAYSWLARENRAMIKRSDAEVAAFDEDEMRNIGVTLGVGSYYVDQTDGSKHAIFSIGPKLIDPEVMFHNVTYGVPIAHFGGKTGNELVAEGRLVEHHYEVDVPLKFSHDPKAVHEDLPPSDSCPYQGFFYPSNEDEDELVH